MGVNFHPEDNIHSGWSLLGRATTVVGANVKKDGSGAPTTGPQGKTGDNVTGTTVGENPEVFESNSSNAVDGGDRVRSPLEAARDAYLKARDDIIKEHDLILKISWPETSRIAEWGIVAHAQMLGKTDKFISGHIPEVKYGRDFDQYSTQHIRNFLDLRREQAETRTLRLIVMKRLRPMHELEGEQFWDAFWQCFVCTCLPCESTTPLTYSLGHYRLWVNGIHHDDISFNNLAYDLSPAGKPEGVLNDYDLASWDRFPTTNNDLTGTVPFMALEVFSGEHIEMSTGRIEEQIPRLYRHDAESFVWVLTYATVINVEYRNHSVKVSRPTSVQAWFEGDLLNHRNSKQALFYDYGRGSPVTESHKQYLTTIKSLIRYWVHFDGDMFDLKHTGPAQQEIDYPKGVLEGLIKGMEAALGADAQKEFAKVKALLLEAISTPKHM